MNELFKIFKNQRNLLISVFCFSFIFYLASCTNTIKTGGNLQATEPVTLANTPIMTLPVTTDEKKDEDLDKMNINNFKPIKECFIKYDFSVYQNGAGDDSTFFVQGEYDINLDGRLDNINILLQGHSRSVQTYIEVNGIKKEFYMDYTQNGEVRIIDLDPNDKFLEIAYFDEGPSADPHYDFYRYDGMDLYEIGSIDSKAIINRQGNLLSSFQISRFKPAFYSAWYEIENNKFVIKNNDIGKYLGKTYKFDGGEAYFIPTEQMPKNPKFIWNEPKHFEACDLKVIDIYFYPEERGLNYYFVEFPNGQRGMFYFWIGD